LLHKHLSCEPFNEVVNLEFFLSQRSQVLRVVEFTNLELECLLVVGSVDNVELGKVEMAKVERKELILQDDLAQGHNVKLVS